MSKECKRGKYIKGFRESLEMQAGNNPTKFILKICKSQHTVHLGNIYQKLNKQA